MEILLIFFPTIITYKIINKKQNYNIEKKIEIYVFYTLLINLFNLLIINLYKLRSEFIISDCFNNGLFCLRYLIVSIILAVILPFIINWLSKNIKFKIEMRKDKNEKGN